MGNSGLWEGILRKCIGVPKKRREPVEGKRYQKVGSETCPSSLLSLNDPAFGQRLETVIESKYKKYRFFQILQAYRNIKDNNIQ